VYVKVSMFGIGSCLMGINWNLRDSSKHNPNKAIYFILSIFWGCKPEPQKILSPQFQSFHERIQVEQFAVALEGVMSIE